MPVKNYNKLGEKLKISANNDQWRKILIRSQQYDARSSHRGPSCRTIPSFVVRHNNLSPLTTPVWYLDRADTFRHCRVQIPHKRFSLLMNPRDNLSQLVVDDLWNSILILISASCLWSDFSTHRSLGSNAGTSLLIFHSLAKKHWYVLHDPCFYPK